MRQCNLAQPLQTAALRDERQDAGTNAIKIAVGVVRDEAAGAQRLQVSEDRGLGQANSRADLFQRQR